MAYDRSSYFGTWFVACLVLVCSAGTILNTLALRHVKRFFNLKVSIFYLVYVGTVTSLVGCAGLLVVSLSMLFGIGRHLVCPLVFPMLYPAFSSGTIINAEIAGIR